MFYVKDLEYWGRYSRFVDLALGCVGGEEEDVGRRGLTGVLDAW